MYVTVIIVMINVLGQTMSDACNVHTKPLRYRSTQHATHYTTPLCFLNTSSPVGLPQATQVGWVWLGDICPFFEFGSGQTCSILNNKL